MNIEKYIENIGISQVKMAGELGISVSALNMYIKKKRYPRPTLAKKIVAYTKGKVKFEEIYE